MYDDLLGFGIQVDSMAAVLDTRRWVFFIREYQEQEAKDKDIKQGIGQQNLAFSRNKQLEASAFYKCCIRE